MTETSPPISESETPPKQQSPTKTAATWWKSLKPGHDDSQGVKRPLLGRSALSAQAVPGVASPPLVSPDGVPLQYAESPIFGVPLDVSLRYAGVRISLIDNEGDSFVYGVVPAIIAKCAVFLKQEARETEGIFRIPGSVRRVRMLQDLFSTPPAFGKNLDWSGFTVHDAANLLKRYFASLPEPVIPLNFYQRFRDPLQKEFAEIDKPEVRDAAIDYYEQLIDALPQSSSKLLLYLIDLLSVFTSESEINRMPAYNLSAIFQPSVLTTPIHDMSPEESEVSRKVLEFLIVHSDTLLERVQQKAIKEHERIKREGTDTVPQLFLPENESAAAATATTAPPATIQGGSATAQSQQQPTRRHSKSVSSAQTPPLSLSDQFYESSSKLSIFRRPRANRTDTGPRTPSEEPEAEDGERKSRFRRSLMVLMPNRGVSRSPSPATPTRE